jgi:ribosomal protein S4
MLKYKIYNRVFKPLSYSEFPYNRLLKFKRSKWIRLKSKIKKQLRFLKRWYSRSLKRKKFAKLFKKFKKVKNKNLNFSILTGVGKSIKFYEKVKKAYKNGLLFKYKYDQFFGSSFSLNYLKKLTLSKNNAFFDFLIKPYLKLDVLMWKLKFFCSVKQAQYHILNKNISVNNMIINTTNYFLHKGDVVEILDKNIKFIKSAFNTSFLLSFCDVDFYTCKIIVLKDSLDLLTDDFKLVHKYLINVRTFIYYLRKK